MNSQITKQYLFLFCQLYLQLAFFIDLLVNQITINSLFVKIQKKMKLKKILFD